MRAIVVGEDDPVWGSLVKADFGGERVNDGLAVLAWLGCIVVSVAFWWGLYQLLTR